MNIQPIEVEIWPRWSWLTDGKYQLDAAKKRGDKLIEAIVREFSADGRLVSTTRKKIKVA